MRVGSIFLLLTLALSSRVEIESHSDGFVAHLARVANKGWEKLVANSLSPEQAQLNLIFAVRQQNTDVLTRELMAVSDPESDRYGKHLSLEQVNTLTAPSSESTLAVTSWLQQHGVTEFKLLTSNGDFIQATVSVAKAEEMLKTTYARYVHSETNTTVLRTSSPYSVPEAVADHLDFVAPTMSFPPVHNRPKKSTVASAAGKFKVTPSYLRNLYNLGPGDISNGTSNNTQAVASFIKSYYDPKDLKLFWAQYPPAAPTTYTDVGVQSHEAEVEASIDSEYISATGAGVPTQMWYTSGVQPGNSENEPFVAWLAKVSSTTVAPNVFSISYGDEEGGVTSIYAGRANVEFQKAGARGITLLAASGDSGAGCAAGAYVPTFPASSPYVTGVGGLQGSKPETVASLSGGGFSNYFPRPSFQDAAVASYVKQPGLPAQKMWNAKGAGFPDVSAQAIQYDTCSDAFFYPYDGTSCAAPTVAGIFSMLNEARIGAGKAPMGYLNPWIYKNAGNGFNDITSGKNNYCDDPSAFPAKKGWDAVSGFGSPDFAKLKPIVLALP